MIHQMLEPPTQANTPPASADSADANSHPRGGRAVVIGSYGSSDSVNMTKAHPPIQTTDAATP